MNDFSKNNALALYKILLQYSDEENQLSMKEILDFMEKTGHSCSEDSVLRYIKQLKEEMDADIISSKGRNAKYFIGTRVFEKEEMKVLVDLINSSTFIEKSVANRMIDKLKGTISANESQELEQNIFGTNIAKTSNKKVLYNIHAIQEAIKQNRQICFDYMGWDTQKKLVKRSKQLYTMNPWALIWANNRYYLYGYDTRKINGRLGERHYRVDKLDNIQISAKQREGAGQFKEFDANTYTSRRKGMFPGKEEKITVRIPENLVGVFIDQFGTGIDVIKDEETYLTVKFDAVPSNILMGWFFGLDEVEVIKPKEIRESFIKMLEENRGRYK